MMITTPRNPIANFSKIDLNSLNQSLQGNKCHSVLEITQNSSINFPIWPDDCLTGNDLIDEQHQTIFAMVNELHRELHTSANPSQLKSILTEIKLHTIEHFEHEEKLMRSHNYTDYKRHKKVHDHLLHKVSKVLAQMKQQNNFVPKENLTEFLTQWLIHHIQGEDQNMIKFFRSIHITESNR